MKRATQVPPTHVDTRNELRADAAQGKGIGTPIRGPSGARAGHHGPLHRDGIATPEQGIHRMHVLRRRNTLARQASTKR